MGGTSGIDFIIGSLWFAIAASYFGLRLQGQINTKIKKCIMICADTALFQ